MVQYSTKRLIKINQGSVLQETLKDKRPPLWREGVKAHNPKRIEMAVLEICGKPVKPR